MRLLALLVIVAPILAAAAMGHSGPGIASACGTYPPLFEEALRDARLVVIGTTQSVGDNSNRFPILPTPTRTPTMPSPRMPSPPPFVTPNADPTRTPFDLTGVGARLQIEVDFSGNAASVVELDTGERERVEGYVREIESWPSNMTPPCDPAFAMTRFSVGNRYLIVDSPNHWGFGVMAWDVSDGLVEAGGPRLRVSQTSFDAFFQRLFQETELRDPLSAIPVEEGVLINDGVLPLADMEVFIRAVLRADSSILPPNTGSAGLKHAHRELISSH